jgi:putative transposase
MPNVKREFITGEIYHIFNRGVEKRFIFENEDDRYRFTFCLYECNDANFVRMSQRIQDRRQKNFTYSQVVQGRTLHKRSLLVEVIAFVLMPNHFHLIVRQLVEGGISLFMKKLSNSYTGYFNDKHERNGMGALFQGRFKSVHVAGNNQFMHLVEYIFSNPIVLSDSSWQGDGANNSLDFISDYKWSSYQDSIGIKNFPSVTERDFLWKVFASSEDKEIGKQNIKKYTQEWIKSKKIMSTEISLE